MNHSLYIHANSILIPIELENCVSPLTLIEHACFHDFLELFITNHPHRASFLDNDSNAFEKATYFQGIFRDILVSSAPFNYTSSHRELNDFVEALYTFWRTHFRCTLMVASPDIPTSTYMMHDVHFNHCVLDTYRTIQERLQGHPNFVYRQLRAGSNAGIILQKGNYCLSDSYRVLESIPYIETVLIHAPLLIHPKTNKREGHFSSFTYNPLNDCTLNTEEFLCYPILVGSLFALVYIHRDFITSIIALGNLFEHAPKAVIENHSPDLIIVFGIEDPEERMGFYYDNDHDLVYGFTAYHSRLDYFGYLKKIILTAFNVFMLRHGWLPIHGSMVNLTLVDGSNHGILFMGDSGAGKSELIAELQSIASNLIKSMDIVFDDMGVMHIDRSGHVVAQGTEIGAFVRLDDLDRSIPYQNMDRAIFMNPESSLNARVVVPISSYETVVHDHPIDYFFYANNFSREIGISAFSTTEDAISCFVKGMRIAKGTTHEYGLTTSYFANPFGPLQCQDLCDPLIEAYFGALFDQNITVGQIYTNLGLPERLPEHLTKTAHALLEFLMEQPEKKQSQ